MMDITCWIASSSLSISATPSPRRRPTWIIADVGGPRKASRSSRLARAISCCAPLPALPRRALPHRATCRRSELTLDKHLPVASGIGGGSSDAAAALRALAALWRRLDDVAALALGLGADVPACLAGCPVWVGGIGERLEPAPTPPPLGIVLANPRRELPTATVFRARRDGFSTPAPRVDIAAPEALFALLERCRNDLTDRRSVWCRRSPSMLNRLADGCRARAWRG